MSLKKIFEKPVIIGICGDVNSGKSMLIYHLIEELRKDNEFNVYAYGLRSEIPRLNKIKTLTQLERIKNSIIIIDEIFSLFNLDNPKEKSNIEKTLRLINHRNNILILVGLGDNFKKFISAKLNYIFIKKISFDNLINGSTMKKAVLSYKGDELGSTLLNLENDETILYNCDIPHFSDIIKIPYIEKYDSKRSNLPIIKFKKPKDLNKTKPSKKIVKKNSQKNIPK